MGLGDGGCYLLLKLLISRSLLTQLSQKPTEWLLWYRWCFIGLGNKYAQGVKLKGISNENTVRFFSWTHLFLSLLCIATFLLSFAPLGSGSPPVSGTEELPGPLVFVGSQPVAVSVELWWRRRLALSSCSQVVSRSHWGPVAVCGDLIHRWGQGAAVSRRPSVSGFSVRFLIAAQALEVAAVVLLTPVPEHMDWQPTLLLHPDS